MLDTNPRPETSLLAKALATQKLDFSRPSGPQIFDALRNAIVWGAIEPGHRLSETEIGSLFGASRTPVREAIGRLKELGLVDVRPNRGTFATRMNAQRIREAQFVREAIELQVVTRLAETGLSASHHAALEANLGAQQTAIASGDQKAFVALDDQFHQLLSGATGYLQAGVLLEQEKLHMDRLRRLSSHREPGEIAVLIAQHERIFRSIITGDAAQARSIMTDHLRRILATLDHFASKQAGYFQ